MQKHSELLKEWEELKEWGDITALSKIIKKDHAAISRMLNGETPITTKDLLKIAAFYNKRKKQLKSLRIEQDAD